MKGLSFFNKAVFFINSCFSLLLLVASGAPYISVEKFSFLSFLSLAVPLLVIANIVFLVYWIVVRKRQLLISLLTLIIGYFSLGTFFIFYNPQADISSHDISILTFNANNFHGIRWVKNPDFENNILNFIEEENADIICFQEFDTSKKIRRLLESYEYKYVNISDGSKESKAGQAIYSRYPIINQGSLDFPETANNGIFADIEIQKDTIRIYNLHLQSLQVRPGSLKREQPYKLSRRLGNSFVKQKQQADQVLAHAMESPYKNIICADLNNTQFSNVYKTIKDDMQDTFMEKGVSYGRTYDFKFLPLRIDFILADKSFEVVSHKNFDERLSDHYPVMASLRLKN